MKILVIGNSFARDFSNILLESPMCDSIQLSYHYGINDCPLSRIRQCDRIYFFGRKHDVPNDIWQNLKPGAEIWGIETKNHGTSNGIFYKNVIVQTIMHNEPLSVQNTILLMVCSKKNGRGNMSISSV